jgi:hypothetical protein
MLTLCSNQPQRPASSPDAARPRLVGRLPPHEVPLSLFGVLCWHSFVTNPRVAKLSFSARWPAPPRDFQPLARLSLEPRAGLQVSAACRRLCQLSAQQVFALPPDRCLAPTAGATFLRVEVEETWEKGSAYTYINRVFLLEAEQMRLARRSGSGGGGNGDGGDAQPSAEPAAPSVRGFYRERELHDSLGLSHEGSMLAAASPTRTNAPVAVVRGASPPPPARAAQHSPHPAEPAASRAGQRALERQGDARAARGGTAWSVAAEDDKGTDGRVRARPASPERAAPPAAAAESRATFDAHSHMCNRWRTCRFCRAVERSFGAPSRVCSVCL